MENHLKSEISNHASLPPENSFMFLLYNIMKNIHIGKAIKEKVKERGIKIIDFANAIHCNRTNIYSIFNRRSIDIEQLLLISEVLEYDFISELYLKKAGEKRYLILLEVNEQQLQDLSSNDSGTFFFMKIIKELKE